jgi:putative NADPH-quinone reductase
MKVLIVNAHPETTSGRSKFNEFQTRINRLLKGTIYYGSGEDEVSRTKDELEDLLFE